MDPVVAAPESALREEDFRLLAPSGFGDGWNHYAHSMAWFQGRLYVGTSRANMASLRINYPVPRVSPWPVECPDELDEIDRRSQIWEYTPETDQWMLVYQAPFVPRLGGGQISHFISYRGMSVYQGLSDEAPCLYVSTWSPVRAGPSRLLRSEDGRNYEMVVSPNWGNAVRSFRSLQYFKGRVHTSPTSSGVKQGFISDSLGSDASVYATNDPRRGPWVTVNDAGFGNPDNLTVFEMEVFNDHLYGGTVNAQTGGEVWKSPGGEVPYKWTSVVTHGGGRGPLSEGVGAMCVFRGALYVSLGVLNGGYHRSMKVGPSAAELIRVWPDDSWELIMGEPRITPQGARYPLSGYSAGFDNLFNGYVWRMCVHEGYLYAGTFTWANLLPYLPMHVWPEDAQALVHRWGMSYLMRTYGGCELWRSADGERWEPVTRSGFGNKFNWGIRNFASTEHGLFVGTTNPYGPTIAVERDGQWQYVHNPRGGCEIWLGKRAPAVAP